MKKLIQYQLLNDIHYQKSNTSMFTDVLKLSVVAAWKIHVIIGGLAEPITIPIVYKENCLKSEHKCE